jgi:hypothetical protein
MSYGSPDKTCPHIEVLRVRDNDELIDLWECDNCGIQFIPEKVLEEEVAQYGKTLDGIASSFSAILWDFTERAIEKYGQQMLPMEGVEELQKCEAGEHKRDDDGLCVVCGDSPFLGAQEAG